MNLYLKRSAYALLILALIIVAYILITPSEESTTQIDGKNTQPSSATVGLAIGNTPPDISLVGIDGKKMQLSDLKGKKVFLNFWATWCPPCRGEMPDIEKMHKTYGNDLTIVAVSSAESSSTVKKFLQKTNYTFPIYLDENANISRTYQLASIPTSYFIDENGIIRQKVIGAIHYDIMQSYYQNL